MINSLEDQSSAHKNQASYFSEQLKLYSALLEGRNYLWKMELEKQFPMKFVFEQIYNDSISLEARSLFCDLALTLYIDQEPLNTRIVPNLCKVFRRQRGFDESSELITSMIGTRRAANFIDESTFSLLIKKAMDMLHEEKEKIARDMHSHLNVSDTSQIRHVKMKNHLNNILLAKIIKLIITMTSFNLIHLIGGHEAYFQVIYNFMHIFEFDKNFSNISYALSRLRGMYRIILLEAKITLVKKQEQAYIRSIKTRSKTMKNNFSGTFQEFSQEAAEAKDVSSLIATLEEGISKTDTQDFENNTDNALFLANPAARSLVVLKQQLDQLVYNDETRLKSNEILIKHEVIEMLDLMLNLRQEFLLTNVVDWYREIIKRVEDRIDAYDINDLLKNFVKSEIDTVLPDLPRTGIEAVDDKYTVKRKVSRWSNLFKKNIATKASSFVKYTEELEFPDLDSLYGGIENNYITKSIGILPSLLVSFVLINDTNLQNKLLTLIMKIFSQKEHLAYNLKNTELIHDTKDIAVYFKIEKWIEDLRSHTRRSEVF